MANRRAEIMLAVLGRAKVGGSLGDLAWNTFVPTCTVMGKRVIERMESGPENTTAVWIKGFASPLYFPNEFNILGLYHVLTETMYPRHWHFYTPPETPIEKGDVVFDCGSAEGLFMLRARQMGATGVVFEPHPTYVRALRQTFANDDAVRIVNAALSNQNDTGLLVDSSYASKIVQDGYDGPCTEVPIETLDSASQRLGCLPTFLKADIEGYEEKMLEGAAEVISSAHPRIAITTYHDENNVDSICKLLRSYCSKYRFRIKGISNRYGKSVMLHAWS